jgi:leucyl aminopeptidase
MWLLFYVTPAAAAAAVAAAGAARVALGPELPVVFSNCDDTWMQLEAASKQEVSS